MIQEDGINTQEYLNSLLADSSIAEAAQENPEGFFNRRNPNLAIQHEKPEHRLAIMLKCQGLSNTEIAKALGFTQAWVGQLFRQPWAQERILQELRSTGCDAIKELIASEASNNLFTIVSVRDNENAPPAVRLNAANSLLDRFLGKAPEKVSIDMTQRAAGDIAAVDRELEVLKQEEARLCGQAAAVDTSSLEQPAERSDATLATKTL